LTDPKFFGLTIQALVSPIYGAVTPWPPFGVSAVRNWDTRTSWRDIETARGVYDWSKLDALIALASSHGAEVMFTLGKTPQWAARDPNLAGPYGSGSSSPPADLADLTAFIITLIAHVGTSIKVFEGWNEANTAGFFAGSQADLIAVQQAYFAAVKAAMPSALVTTPSFTNYGGCAWADGFMAALGGYADIGAFHGYTYYPNTTPPIGAEQIGSIAASYVAMFASHGLSRVWNTEAGYRDTDVGDINAQSAFIAKAALLNWSAGVERMYAYAYDSPYFGTMRSGTAIELPGVAWNQMHGWFGSGTLTRPISPAGTIWSGEFTKPSPAGFSGLVIWDTAGSQFTVPAQYVQYRNVYGNPTAIPANRIVALTGSPLLFETVAY